MRSYTALLNNKWISVAIDLAVLLACCFLLFYKITEFPVRIWDEAIYANNAVEMAEHGRPFRLLNNGVPNYYNANPPFVIWLQTLCIKLFGINVFAIRLPTLLASLLVLYLVFRFARIQAKSKIASWLAPLILILSFGFLRDHVSRTGDLDGVLLLLSTILSITVFKTLLGKALSNRDLWILSICTTLGFLTKSVAIFLIFPAILAVLLLTRIGRSAFFKWQLYALMSGSFMVIFMYVIISTFQDPVNIETIIRSYVARSYIDIMPWHKQEFTFFLSNLIERNFLTPFIYFIPLPLLVFFKKDKPLNTLIVGLYLFLFVFEMTIALPPNKLEWYDASAYPIFALLIAIGLNGLIDLISRNIPWLKILIPIAILIALAILISQRIYHLKAQSDTIYPLEKEGYCLNELSENFILEGQLSILMEVEVSPHYHQLNFYRKQLAYSKGINTKLYPYLFQLMPGDTVLSCQQEKIDSMLSSFHTNTLFTCRDCKLLELGKQRQTSN